MALSQALINEVFRRDSWRCRSCRVTNNLHPHHLQFKSHGGKDEASNLLTLCACCHLRGIHGGNLSIFVASTGERCTGSNVVDATQKLRFVRRKGWKPQ